MKRAEIGYTAIMNELEKLNARLEKAQKALEKKHTAAEKVGVADWNDEEHRNWLKAVPATPEGFIANKEDVKKNGAWFDLAMAKDNVQEIESKIEKAESRLDKAQAEVQQYRAEIEKMEDLKAKEALMQKEFEKEQREWAKDGITLKERYAGVTPGGRKFNIIGNCGLTDRSRHCFTLYIEGDGCVFTSGEFWRAYGVIKNR